jgi:hypothetical protein
MPITAITAVAGVAKQSSKGNLPANPTFAHGLMGGAPITVDASQSALEVTTGKRAAANIIRESVTTSVEVQSPAYLKTLGLYLLGAMGSVTTTGSAPGPYTHTFATGDLPYLGFFAKGIGADIEAIRDCKIDELTLSWEGARPLELSVSANGTVFSYPSTFTPSVDETASESFLVPVGGTFEYDPLGSSVASARVIGGELMIKNNVATIDASASVVSDDVQEGSQEHTLKLTIVPENLADFRKTVTGSGSGAGISETVPLGSVNLVFRENGGTGTLTVTGSKVAFLTAFPEADPSGAAIEIELSGMALVAPGGTSPLTYVLANGQASY